jgi:hypothetical protein
LKEKGCCSIPISETHDYMGGSRLVTVPKNISMKYTEGQRVIEVLEIKTPWTLEQLLALANI